MALLFALGLVVGGMISVTATVGTSHSVWRVPILCVSELSFLLFFFAFTLFPDGRLIPSWTRWLLVGFSLLTGAISVSAFFTNPFSVPLWIATPVLLLFCSLNAGLVVAQIYRYRYVSTPIQRQQTKWVVSGFTANVLIFVGGILPTLLFPRSLYPLLETIGFTCTLILYPFTIGMAIFRSHLWDIDAIINKALVYGLLSVLLAAVYVGLILGLQALLGGLLHQSNTIALVVSTLIIYALFRPLHRRIQAIIDRRFYRRKYDAAKVLAAFSATLRHEVDLDQLREQLPAVVQETMQPASVSLWLRPLEHPATHQTPWRTTPPAPSDDEAREER
jgi:hypothetical protein